MLFQNPNDLTHDKQCSLSKNAISKYREAFCVNKLENEILIIYPPLATYLSYFQRQITYAACEDKNILPSEVTNICQTLVLNSHHHGKQNQGLFLVYTSRTVFCCTCTGYHETVSFPRGTLLIHTHAIKMLFAKGIFLCQHSTCILHFSKFLPSSFHESR